MVEAGKLVALQATGSFARDARGTIALGRGMQQLRDSFPHLWKRDRRSRFSLPTDFRVDKPGRDE